MFLCLLKNIGFKVAKIVSNKKLTRALNKNASSHFNFSSSILHFSNKSKLALESEVALNTQISIPTKQFADVPCNILIYLKRL